MSQNKDLSNSARVQSQQLNSEDISYTNHPELKKELYFKQKLQKRKMISVQKNKVYQQCKKMTHP